MSLATREWVVGAIFLFQSLLGILGNVFLFSQYVWLDYTGYKLRPTDVIVKNLIVANFLALFTCVIRDAMELFGWDHISDLICSFLSYAHRVSRGVIMSTTCFLSVFQAAIISPRSASWEELKAKSPKCVVNSLVLCWSVNLLINIIFPIFLNSTLNRKNTSTRKSFSHCSSVHHDSTRHSLCAVLFFFTDAICLGLMFWASSSMVSLLYRHKQRIQHLQRSKLSSRSSPETRATQTILLLASTFLCFYTLSSILHNLWLIFNHLNWFFLNITKVFSLCFPTVSPYLLLHRDASVFRFCSSCMGIIKSPTPVRNV